MNGKRVKKLRLDFMTFMRQAEGHARVAKKTTYDENGVQLTKDEFRVYKRLFKKAVKDGTFQYPQ